MTEAAARRMTWEEAVKSHGDLLADLTRAVCLNDGDEAEALERQRDRLRDALIQYRNVLLPYKGDLAGRVLEELHAQGMPWRTK